VITGIAFAQYAGNINFNASIISCAISIFLRHQ
jgi:hypothetical protein